MKDSLMSPQALMLAGAGFLALVLLPVLGGGDIGTWYQWAEYADSYGLVDGYAFTQNEHPPLLSALFLLSIRLARWCGVEDIYGLKASFLVFVLLTTAILYRLSARALYPTLFFYAVLAYGALCLSYMDIYTAPFIVLALVALGQRNYSAFSFCFSLACLIKYPSLMLAPFLLVYVIREFRVSLAGGRQLANAIWSLAWPASLLALSMVAVFGLLPFEALQRAFQHFGLTANALNLGYVVKTFELVDQSILGPASNLHGINFVKGVILLRIPYLFFLGTTLIVFARRHRTLEELVLFCILGHLCYFFLNLGVHENHLFLSVLLAMLLYCLNPASLPLAVGISAIYCLNLFTFYGVLGTDGLPYYSGLPMPEADLAWSPVSMYPAVDMRLMLAVFNVGYFLATWAYHIRRDFMPPASASAAQAA